MSERYSALGEGVRRAAPVRLAAGERVVLFVSHSDGATRARVFTVSASDAGAAWEAALARIQAVVEPVRWLRVDWVRAVEASDWGALRARLARTKRNYFRLGIALDAGFERAFLETELNANAMLYGGPRVATACVNEGNFLSYARKRHGVGAVDFGDGVPVWLFSTRGVLLDADGALHAIDGQGRDAGRRSIDGLTPERLFEVIDAGSRYLATQVEASGRFVYGWHPCFDRPIGAYNSLRHASTLYAMLEAWDVTRDATLFAAIGRALDHLTRELIRGAVLADGREAAFLIDPGDEIKLGGNAVAILALVKHAELTGSGAYRPLMAALARGILSMQDVASGRFSHVLHFPSLAVKQEFRIIYYDGEAAFALMRLYALTRDPVLIAAVERAFDHFIAAEHQQAHDHWLSYCVNELTRYRPEERYFRFGIENFRDHLAFVEHRITTFPTLLELMMAAAEMIARLRADAAHAHLLDTVDPRAFERAMHARAAYLMNGHFWPELAMFFANPGRIAGAFFIRHHGFRVRIDDVEHYLSGLIAYRRYLLEGAETEDARETGWTARSVAAATGGRWVTPPPEGWSAAGLCSHAPAMRAGDMVVVRGEGEARGVTASRVGGLAHRPAAVIASAPENVATVGVPVLRVADAGAAMLALGRHARARMTGTVIGVTGSAGKTTMVAMLLAMLEDHGVAAARCSANLPHGIAWNLASMPWDVPHVVLELAIGRMAQNAALARPDIAVFTNIFPAHLEHHHDLATIARRKSAIFGGMAAGGVAILNSDMAEGETVAGLAREHGLRVVGFGAGEGAAFRLLDYSGTTGEVVATTPEERIRYRLAAPGRHMAMNSLAALATAWALGIDLGEAAAALGAFRPLGGRGEEIALTIGGRRATLIDEAYNANPGSMAAALEMLRERPARRRVLVLGEMHELGAQAAAHHTALARIEALDAVDKVHAAGALYADFWRAIAPERRGAFADKVEPVGTCVVDDLRDDDLILIKGSQASGINRIVSLLSELSS